MNYMPSRQEAARELLRRQDSAESLIAFTEYTYPRYKTARHHRIIAEQIERVIRREIDRLMLLVPPRHGKTELASKRGAAFNIGCNPHRQIIAASATETYATDVGREVRNIVGSQEFANIFPGVSLAADSAAAGRWHTKQGGIFSAVGVGSQILGRGADDFIIDDPFPTMEDAQSETQRRKVIEWYQGSVYNRLQPGGTITLINHRMHDEDLSGYLIERQNFDGDKWEIVELPAIDTEGNALWPESYPIEALLRIKANTLPRFWSGLFQQNPQPDEGTYFQRDWFKTRYTQRPAALNIYGTSDYAVTDEGGDYTVHRVWGIAPDGALYMLDGWRGQTSSDKWIEEKLALIKRWKPFAWFGEGGVIQKSIEPALKRRMREAQIFCRLEWVPSIHDKPTRARGFQARASMGLVRLPVGPVGDAILDEYLRFPAGKHDDEVDCGGLIGRALDEAHPAIARPQDGARPVDRWTIARQRDAGTSGGWAA